MVGALGVVIDVATYVTPGSKVSKIFDILYGSAEHRQDIMDQDVNDTEPYCEQIDILGWTFS